MPQILEILFWVWAGLWLVSFCSLIQERVGANEEVNLRWIIAFALASVIPFISVPYFFRAVWILSGKIVFFKPKRHDQ